MPNTIQPGEYSTGGGAGGNVYGIATPMAAATFRSCSGVTTGVGWVWAGSGMIGVAVAAFSRFEK